MEIYASGTSTNLMGEKEEITNSNITKFTEIINFDDVTKENIKEHNRNWPQLPDHLYRILISGGSGSGETSLLFNLICHQPDTDKMIKFIYMQKISMKQNINS